MRTKGNRPPRGRPSEEYESGAMTAYGAASEDARRPAMVGERSGWRLLVTLPPSVPAGSRDVRVEAAPGRVLVDSLAAGRPPVYARSRAPHTDWTAQWRRWPGRGLALRDVPGGPRPVLLVGCRGAGVRRASSLGGGCGRVRGVHRRCGSRRRKSAVDSGGGRSRPAASTPFGAKNSFHQGSDLVFHGIRRSSSRSAAPARADVLVAFPETHARVRANSYTVRKAARAT